MKTDYKTIVFGASLKEYRYSHRAVKVLKLHGYDVVPIGLKEGEIDGIKILTGTPHIEDIHTITMYVNAKRQKPMYDYLLSLNPDRIIFNPGAENLELAEIARKRGILTEDACTLVMLSIGEYEKLPPSEAPVA